MVWKTSRSSVAVKSSTSGTGTFHEDSRVEWFNPPASVSGAWINYPDGSRFRRATNYGRSHLKLTPGTPANLIARRWNGPIWSKIGLTGVNPMNNFGGGNWIFRFDIYLGVPSLLQPPGLPTMERNEAITKSLNDIANQKANIGENLATLGQTVRMFKNPLIAYEKAVNSYFKNKSLLPFLQKSYRQLRRDGVSKAIAGKYLEYVYGFAPLMSDIYGIAELAKEAGKKPLFLSGKGTAHRDLASSNLTYSNASADQDETMALEATAKTRAILWAKLSSDWSATRVLNQLGLTNPASLIWELVPMSFVVDWVLPIGPVLSALTAPCGLDFVNGSISRRVSAHGGFSIMYRPWNQSVALTNTPGTGSVDYEGYVRQEITSWPAPGVWIDQDPLRLKRDGSDRDFKALALWISRLSR